MTIRPPSFDASGLFDPSTGYLWRWYDNTFDQAFYISGTASIGAVTGSGTGKSLYPGGDMPDMNLALAMPLMGWFQGRRESGYFLPEPQPQPDPTEPEPIEELPTIHAHGTASIGEITGHGEGTVTAQGGYIGEIVGHGEARVYDISEDELLAIAMLLDLDHLEIDSSIRVAPAGPTGFERMHERVARIADRLRKAA